MKSRLQPWHLLLRTLSGWINRQQQDVVEYLLTDNQMRREKLGKKRILLNGCQRRRLAIKGKILKARGIEAAPDRKRQSTWKTFLEARWDVLASVDFITI